MSLGLSNSIDRLQCVHDSPLVPKNTSKQTEVTGAGIGDVITS